MWSYRVDGTLEQSQMFVKGLLHGPSILYHTDGSTVVRSLQFMHNLQVVVAAAAAALFLLCRLDNSGLPLGRHVPVVPQ